MDDAKLLIRQIKVWYVLTKLNNLGKNLSD